MKVENLKVNLKEAYWSSDGDLPSVCLTGIGKGEGWEGPLEVVIRGVGVKLDGLTIGEEMRLTLEPQIMKVAIELDARDAPE